jgi:hypothetical protein
MALILGLTVQPFVLAATMIIVEIVFCICLAIETKQLQN